MAVQLPESLRHKQDPALDFSRAIKEHDREISGLRSRGRLTNSSPDERIRQTTRTTRNQAADDEELP